MKRVKSLRMRLGLGVGIGLPLAIMSCGQPSPPTAVGPEGPVLAAQPGDAPAATARTLWTRAFDVDPFHAAAFPSLEEVAGADAAPFAAEVTAVAHDLDRGRTRVTLRLTPRGTAVPDLSVEAGSGLEAGVHEVALGALAAQGPAREVALELPNPAAASFTLNLGFTGRPPAAGPRYRLQAVTATASSSTAGYGPARAVDGNLSTQWASGYRVSQATLTLDLGASQAIAQLKTKQAPLSATGAYYVIEVSATGSSWTAVSGQLRNSTWGLETRTLPAGTTARYLRLRFVNATTSPVNTFSVFENQVVGGTSPGASPTPAPSTAPSSTPAPGGGLTESFEGYAIGSHPSSWVDPNDEGYAYSWMPRVPWRITSLNGSKQFVHDGLNTRAVLNFRRYRGGALGGNGTLPNRYFAEVRVTPVRSYTYSPTGDQGTQVFYLSPTSYVEVLIKPTLFEVWQANNAQPFTSAGWSRLYVMGTSTAANQSRWLGADIDLGAGTITAYLDRVRRTTVRASLLTPRTHYFALRGAGNVVGHDDVRIAPR